MNEPVLMEQKHSGLGIASFILSLVCGLMIFVLFVVAGVIEVSTPGGMDEESAAAIIIGLLIFLDFFILLVAIGLGIGGLIQKERKRLFAILGLVFSIGILFTTMLLMLIGLTA